MGSTQQRMDISGNKEEEIAGAMVDGCGTEITFQSIALYAG